jgi:hypothetical protein
MYKLLLVEERNPQIRPRKEFLSNPRDTWTCDTPLESYMCLVYEKNCLPEIPMVNFEENEIQSQCPHCSECIFKSS